MWRFLFGMYPCSSTALERPLLEQQLLIRYLVMKRKWQQSLPSAVQMRVNGTDGKFPWIGVVLKTWCNSHITVVVVVVGFLNAVELVAAIGYFNTRQAQVKQQIQEHSEEVRERQAFLELQAQVWL